MNSFLDNIIAERDRLQKLVEAMNGVIEAYEGDGEAERPVKRVISRKPKASHPWRKGDAVVRKCKNCGKVGHRRDGCPELKNGTDNVEDEELDEELNDNDDEPTESRQVTREQVQELKDQGLNSLQIASKLRMTLKEVNKNW